MHRGLIADGRNETYGNRPPRDIGSSASPLMDYLDGRHYEARLSDKERATVRLWIDSSAVYAGSYGALASGMFPVEFPFDTVARRCGSCHGKEVTGKQIGTGNLYFRFGQQGPHFPLVHEFKDLQQIRGSIGYYKFGNARPPQSLCNLSRPDKSLLVQAPLAREAGGLTLCGQLVFPSTSDPDYQTLLGRILAASKRHDEGKRFDMPGFQPNIYYIRTMQDHGFLPPDLKSTQAVDIYAADEAYWRSFWK
ncbi:MAG: hypothetical protein ACC628_12590 [Pirellulaceae bacterium]